MDLITALLSPSRRCWMASLWARGGEKQAGSRVRRGRAALSLLSSGRLTPYSQKVCLEPLCPGLPFAGRSDEFPPLVGCLGGTGLTGFGEE